MARLTKNGLGYISVDHDFFHKEIISAVEEKFGIEGTLYALQLLLFLGHQKGCWLEWSAATAFFFAKEELRDKSKKDVVTALVEFLVDVGFFVVTEGTDGGEKGRKYLSSPEIVESWVNVINRGKLRYRSSDIPSCIISAYSVFFAKLDLKKDDSESKSLNPESKSLNPESKPQIKINKKIKEINKDKYGIYSDKSGIYHPDPEPGLAIKPDDVSAGSSGSLAADSTCAPAPEPGLAMTGVSSLADASALATAEPGAENRPPVLPDPEPGLAMTGTRSEDWDRIRLRTKCVLFGRSVAPMRGISARLIDAVADMVDRGWISFKGVASLRDAALADETRYRESNGYRGVRKAWCSVAANVCQTYRERRAPPPEYGSDDPESPPTETERAAAAERRELAASES